MWRQSSKCDTNACLQVNWQKSSRSGSSNGACLEAKFAKSSYSDANGNCLEAKLQDAVLVRDSKLLDRATDTYHGPILSFSTSDWDAFIKSPLVRT